MSCCAWLGTLLVHGPAEYVSTPADGGQPTRIVEIRRCPQCATVSCTAPHLCAECLFHMEAKETPR